MHKILLFLFGLFLMGSLFAAPISNLKKVVTQPDGSKLELFLSGNEYSHRLHDADNYSVIQGKDGYYYYAVNDSEGNVVPSAYRYGSINPATAGILKGIDISEERYRERWEKMHARRPEPNIALMELGEPLHLGKMHNVVVFIRFADDDEFEKPREEFEIPFNGEAGESLKNFYEEVSYGKFTIESAFFPKCEPGKNLSYQDTEKREVFENKEGGAREEILMLRRALKSVTSELEAHYSPEQLDKNGDGKVDNVTFIIRGDAGAWSSLLWAHKGWLGTDEKILVHGLLVQDYILEPETLVNVRTTCHEMYHGLGAPDLYQYESDNNYNPVGGWDLMGGGFVHMSAYLKWKYTNHLWVEDIPEITKSGRYSLKPLASGNQKVAYRINVGSEDGLEEWLVLEFRKKVGIYEKNLPQSGLLVSRVMPWKNGNSSAPWEVYVYCPGGTDTQQGDQALAALSKESGRVHLGNDTDPQLFLVKSGKLKTGMANVEISEVSEAKSDEIFFTITLPDPKMDTIRLKPGGTGDGSSWARAAGDLKKAIQHLHDRKRGEIWLAGGTWAFPEDTLRIKEYVKIYGGFQGTERSKEERQKTDRNGDGRIDPWEFGAVSKLDFSGQGQIIVEWSYDYNPVYLDGFTISGLNGSLRIPWNGVFTGMEICDNSADAGKPGLLELTDRSVLEKSYIHHNQGGGHLIYQHGGDLRNCAIINNHVSEASLLSLGGSAYFRNCLVANNTTEKEPGITVDQSIPEICNNTIVHNQTKNEKGWLVAPDNRRAKIQMYNTILWGNTTEGVPEVDVASVYRMQWCAIQGYRAEDYAAKEEVVNNICLEAGNKGLEAGKFYPSFKKESQSAGIEAEGYSGADWSCEGNSACIDAGDNKSGTHSGMPDLAGHLRIMNNRIDIGAYENLKPEAATIELADLNQVYTGEPLSPSVTTIPEGLEVKLTYNGLPVNGGTYTVVAEITDPSYTGSQNAVFNIEKADQTLLFDELPDAYVGEERVLRASASSGLPVSFRIGDGQVAEIKEDTVIVFKQLATNLSLEAVCPGNENYKAVSVSRQLNVLQNKAILSLQGLQCVYDGEAHPVRVKAVPEVSCEVTYNGRTEAPVNAGKYVVKAVVNEAGYAGYCIDTLDIAKAATEIIVHTDEVVYNGAEQWPEITTIPAGIALVRKANGQEKAPCHAGTYQIGLTVDDPNYEGYLEQEFVIKRKPVEIVLDESSLEQVYKAQYLDVKVATVPDDHEIDIVYKFDPNGSENRPFYAGNYTVTMAVDEVDYYAEMITRRMTVKKAPVSVRLDRSVLEQTYNGQPFEVTAVVMAPVSGVIYKVFYNGVEQKPVDAGIYKVTAEVQDYWRYEGYDTVELHIRKAPQQITFVHQQTEFDLDVASLLLEGVASSGLGVVYESSVPSVASIENDRLIFHQGGTTVVTARQAGNKNYEAADPVALTFTLNKLSQEITWTQQLDEIRLNSGPVELTAKASSDLVVEYVSGNEKVAVVEAGMLKLKGVGQAVITARQDGNGVYKAAEPVTKTITVVHPETDFEAVDLIVAGRTHDPKFRIKDVEFLEENHLMVMSKAGEVVYERNNYDNTYDMGQVPAGTYYYVFTWKNTQGIRQTKKGFVEVVRH